MALSGESVGLTDDREVSGSNAPGENLDFVRNLLFPLLKNSKSVADDKRLANAILYKK